MKKPEIAMIAALSKSKGLGKNGQLLFSIKEDLRHFKNLTSGHPIIMGRKTFESIGKPLPNRTNIIITRQPGFTAEGCTVTHSLDEAISEGGKEDGLIFIIGGGELYKEALPRTDRLHLTIIDSDVPADTFFPDYSEFKTVIHQESHQTSEGLPYSFVELVR